MKFYQDANELLEGETPIRIRSQLYPYFISGVTAFEELVQENERIFKSDFFQNIKGWLLNYMVYRQFESDMISHSFPFVPLAKKVNNFNYKTLNLLNDNVIINVSKCMASETLPDRAKYKKRLCRLNEFKERSLFLDVDPTNHLVVKSQPYFMFLTYGVRRGEVQFADLIVPNSSMTECLAVKRLKDELSVYDFDIEEEKTIEKRVAILKKDVVDKLKIIK